MKWLALDIGGANLKVADGRGHAESFPFELWRQPSHLAQELRTLIARSPACDHIAATMTGELADCFESKSAGVEFILDALHCASDGRHTRVYLSDGSLVTLQVAKSRPASVAAANWHALARFAARYTDGLPSLLVDIGSTTCDVIPLLDGEPATNQRADTARLLRGELIYAGVERTPVCSLVTSLPYRGQSCPIARELFATTCDVYTLLGKLPEKPMSRNTADGRAVTKAAARARLARMICADVDDFNHRDAALAAEAVSNAFTQELIRGITQVIAGYSFEPGRIILSGIGAFAAKKALEQAELPWKQVFLANEIGPAASCCAPAHALAVLAREAVSV
ncbi:MAG: H4MPT-linked C1 transfer pathway protein [Planctomycetaceae bacterium]|nr:hypothetical protein [Planctomycetales bacterium]MCB9925508.1 H4MPT-linked C1 transfer pathway protein [Planctomycetaceae bacterium]